MWKQYGASLVLQSAINQGGLTSMQRISHSSSFGIFFFFPWRVLASYLQLTLHTNHTISAESQANICGSSYFSVKSLCLPWEVPIILQSQDPDLAVLVKGNVYQLQQKPHLSNLYLERQLEQQWQPMDHLSLWVPGQPEAQNWEVELF